MDEKVVQRAAREIELKSKIQALTERLNAARAERDRFAQLLAEREEAERRFGGETPDEVLKRLRALEEERDQLRKALAAGRAPRRRSALKSLSARRNCGSPTACRC